jgi:hypothetical protein
VLQVCAHNNSDSTVFVYMYVDGQKVALYAAEPHAYCTFSDVAVASNPKEREEMLFSLPRRVTQAEKKRAGTQFSLCNCPMHSQVKLPATAEQRSMLAPLQCHFCALFYRRQSSHTRANCSTGHYQVKRNYQTTAVHIHTLVCTPLCCSELVSSQLRLALRC